jgi:hypothetical protein
MLKDYLTLILRETGTENIKNILPRIAFIVRHVGAGSGLSPEMFIRKMVGNMASVVAARPKFVVFVTANGMAPKIVQRMRKQIVYLKRLNKPVGNDVIVAELWWN